MDVPIVTKLRHFTNCNTNEKNIWKFSTFFFFNDKYEKFKINRKILEVHNYFDSDVHILSFIPLWYMELHVKHLNEETGRFERLS